MSYKKFTDEEVERAGSVDLVSFLQNQGESLKEKENLMLGWTTSSSRTSANTNLCNDVNKVTAIFSKNKTEIKYDNIVYISNIKKLYSNIPNLSDKFSDTLQERLSYII